MFEIYIFFHRIYRTPQQTKNVRNPTMTLRVYSLRHTTNKFTFLKLLSIYCSLVFNAVSYKSSGIFGYSYILTNKYIPQKIWFTPEGTLEALEIVWIALQNKSCVLVSAVAINLIVPKYAHQTFLLFILSRTSSPFKYGRHWYIIIFVSCTCQQW